MADERDRSRNGRTDGRGGAAARRGAEPFERRHGERAEASADADEAYVETEEYAGPDRRSVRERPSSSRKWRERLNQWRQPIIGLTIAGAAAPLIKDGVSPQDARPGTGERRPGEGEASARAGVAVDDQVSERWREAAERNARHLTVAGAVARYADFGLSEELASDIYDAAVQEGVEPDLAFGLIKTESGFRERATSHVGARGLTQVLPSTARWIMPEAKGSSFYERDVNLRAGFRYLRKLIEDFDGNVKTALLAYNRGPGTVNKILKRGGNPDNGYADKVLGG